MRGGSTAAAARRFWRSRVGSERPMRGANEHRREPNAVLGKGAEARLSWSGKPMGRSGACEGVRRRSDAVSASQVHRARSRPI